jgi:hypothetical protein
MPQPVGTPAGILHVGGLSIERIVLLGLPLKDRSYSVHSGGRKLEVLAGVGADARLGQGAAVVVRAPALPIGADWELTVSDNVEAWATT